MKHALAEPRGYASMLQDTDYPWCWYCGRTQEDRPEPWHAPWLIERCHIVSMPRIEDRRVVVLMCSRCHRVQSGDLLKQSLMVERPGLEQMLWLKHRFDWGQFDREFLGRFSVRKLPVMLPPCVGAVQRYMRRRGDYPIRGVSIREISG